MEPYSSPGFARKNAVLWIKIQVVIPLLNCVVFIGSNSIEFCQNQLYLSVSRQVNKFSQLLIHFNCAAKFSKLLDCLSLSLCVEVWWEKRHSCLGSAGPCILLLSTIWLSIYCGLSKPLFKATMYTQLSITFIFLIYKTCEQLTSTLCTSCMSQAMF